MSDQAAARKKIRNEFGLTVATKASDAFVQLYAAAADAPFGLESFGAAGAPPRVPTILEMSVRTPETPMERVDSTRFRSAQRAAAEALDQLGFGDAPLAAVRALRGHAVEQVRDAFLTECGGVLDELERATAGPLGPLSEAVTLRAARPQLVDACWLNNTIRTAADPRTVAVVADDPRVEVIDVPKRLFKEIGSTCTLVGAPAFRSSKSVAGQGVIVAVIDSEVAAQHTGLGARIIHKGNYTKEPWGHPDGHGTAVAGIIGAFSDSHSGMAPEVTIYNYKVLATVDALNADDFGGTLAIQQALEDGAQVANCSWGAGRATDGTSREARACNRAWSLGLVIVKSAGNRGPAASSLTTPADADGVIVVGATDRKGKSIPDYSSRGPFKSPDGKNVARPHLVAPGGAREDPMTSCTVGAGGFGLCGVGTSFAAPHVTGAIALLLSVNPHQRPDEIRDAILKACVPLKRVAKGVQGQGLLKM